MQRSPHRIAQDHKRKHNKVAKERSTNDKFVAARQRVQQQRRNTISLEKLMQQHGLGA